MLARPTLDPNPPTERYIRKGNGVGASAGVEEDDLAHRLGVFGGGIPEFGSQFLCLQATYDFLRHQPFPVTQA